MEQISQSIDSSAWTGEVDYVEVESLPASLGIFGLMIVMIVLLV